MTVCVGTTDICVSATTTQVLTELPRLWHLAERDMLDPTSPYALRDTGQGLNRVQRANRVAKAMGSILAGVQSKLGSRRVALPRSNAYAETLLIPPWHFLKKAFPLLTRVRTGTGGRARRLFISETITCPTRWYPPPQYCWAMPGIGSSIAFPSTVHCVCQYRTAPSSIACVSTGHRVAA
eukprot:2771005-Rhodomonas_salina.1